MIPDSTEHIQHPTRIISRSGSGNGGSAQGAGWDAGGVTVCAFNEMDVVLAGAGLGPLPLKRQTVVWPCNIVPPVGSTYNNHQVRAASAESVIAACQAAKIGPAQVSRVSGGWVTVLTDTLDIRGLKQLMLEGSRLSNRVGAPVLTTLVNDNDRLSY